MEFIGQSLSYLDDLIEHDEWSALRRRPPCFTILDRPMESVTALVSRYVANQRVPNPPPTMT